jgi:hypothetical protein
MVHVVKYVRPVYQSTAHRPVISSPEFRQFREIFTSKVPDGLSTCIWTIVADLGLDETRPASTLVRSSSSEAFLHVSDVASRCVAPFQ